MRRGDAEIANQFRSVFVCVRRGSGPLSSRCSFFLEFGGKLSILDFIDRNGEKLLFMLVCIVFFSSVYGV